MGYKELAKALRDRADKFFYNCVYKEGEYACTYPGCEEQDLLAAAKIIEKYAGIVKKLDALVGRE